MTVRGQRDLLYATIDEMNGLYLRKEISPVEVMKATLDRLYALEPQLNAFITVMEDQALDAAAESEKRYLASAPRGKLDGIPVSLKDLFDTKDIRTTMGSRIMKDNIPERDAYVYTALRDSGAVVFGKASMLEFAFGFVHPDYGQTNNPWNVRRAAGGSSTGSGASVSAGIGFGSIGTDTGGSIRAPGSFCGIVGLKPTYDRISRAGCFPLSDSLDHVGPLTRTVKDNALLLEALSSFRLKSPLTTDLKGLRVGVIRSLTDTVADEEIRHPVLSAIATLRELGAEVTDVAIPMIHDAEAIALPILLAEA